MNGQYMCEGEKVLGHLAISMGQDVFWKLKGGKEAISEPTQSD